MAFSKPQQWLTAGFGLLLASLVGTAFTARQAILEQATTLSLFEAMEAKAEVLEDFLFALSNADSIRDQYFESQTPEILNNYEEQLDLIDSFREDLLFEAQLIPPEEEAYQTALEQLTEAINQHLENLEQVFVLESVPALSDEQKTTLTERSRETEAAIEKALELFLQAESESTEQPLEVFPDVEIETNNALWKISIVTGIGSLTASILYVWLLRLLGQQAKQNQALEQENQRLGESFQSQQQNLESITSSLQDELSRRQEIETTYKEVEEAKELSDLKLNFFSLASHELRTPLSAILVSAQLLDNAHAPWTEEKRSRNLKRIQSSAKTMTQLLSDILLLTRAEAGKLEFSPQQVELLEFSQALVDEVKFNAQAHQQIVVQHQGSCDIAYLDQKLLRAMLMSLLTNSIKYSPQESQIQLTIIGEVHQVCFQLQDQGIGIPLADQQHLFESFRRGSNAEKTPGTGLGLAVVKKCLDLHGGHIELDSQVGLGTTFIINLPWQQPSETVPSLEASTPKLEQRSS